MKGQVSAEMLILLAAVIAVVAIAAAYLIELGEHAGEQVQEMGGSIAEEAKNAGKGGPGAPCISGNDCESGSCGGNRCA